MEKVETVGVRVPASVTGMLNVPALVHRLAAGAELHRRRLGDGQRVDRGTAQARPRGRAQGQCQRLVGAGVGEERAGDVFGGLPDPEHQRTGRDAAVGDARAAVPPSVNGTVRFSVTWLSVPLAMLAT